MTRAGALVWVLGVVSIVWFIVTSIAPSLLRHVPP
jgi:hypothetical protein